MPTRDASRTRSRARRGDGARLREEILEAATELLLETGDEAAEKEVAAAVVAVEGQTTRAGAEATPAS